MRRLRQPVPAWARRREREREAAADERFNDRLGTLMGFMFVNVVWSNDTLQAYHPRCRQSIPTGPHGTVDMTVDPDDPRTATCGCCGGSLRE